MNHKFSDPTMVAVCVFSSADGNPEMKTKWYVIRNIDLIDMIATPIAERYKALIQALSACPRTTLL
jgi:hypothetical protein